jgi:hypothetical protein
MGHRLGGDLADSPGLVVLVPERGGVTDGSV